mmetsp:Transcript_14109/g.2053  ORF Transcript_14109/g.2053 Transcript_14109/m.2053 type:complete len:81 (+) Transcript_14109:95-337(+)
MKILPKKINTLPLDKIKKISKINKKIIIIMIMTNMEIQIMDRLIMGKLLKLLLKKAKITQTDLISSSNSNNRNNKVRIVR